MLRIENVLYIFKLYNTFLLYVHGSYSMMWMFLGVLIIEIIS